MLGSEGTLDPNGCQLTISRSSTSTPVTSVWQLTRSLRWSVVSKRFERRKNSCASVDLGRLVAVHEEDEALHRPPHGAAAGAITPELLMIRRHPGKPALLATNSVAGSRPDECLRIRGPYTPAGRSRARPATA